ncbi:hypothetical protein FO519_001814 [Halicephalobus sp. NKZ332]|nr:hypothetical protein FO519_001814 [Halicephalobus sp. NKZ332]
MIQNKVFCLLFLISLCGIRGVEADCDGDLTTCFKNFSAAIGISDTLNFNRYINGINNLLDRDVDLLCNAQANLSQCVNSTNQEVNYDNMVCIFKTDNNSAAQVVSRYHQLQYGCGDVIYQLSNAVTCSDSYYFCDNSKESIKDQPKATCPNSGNITCALKNVNSSCGSVNTYIGCQWKSIENQYVVNCSPSPDCSPYDSLWNTTQCFYNYFKAWGTPSNNTSPRPDSFGNYFQTYAIASTDSYNAACDRYNEFYKCIGGTDDAFNTLNFAQILTRRFDNDTANAWISVFKQQDFICSNGVDGLEELMECDDATLDCGQYSSGSAVGIGMTLIFSFLIGLLN